MEILVTFVPLVVAAAALIIRLALDKGGRHGKK